MTGARGKNDIDCLYQNEGAGEPTLSEGGVANEGRRGVRMPYKTGVQLDTHIGPIYGTTRNIGSGGLFVDTKVPLPTGQKVELKFKFRSGTHFIRLPAQVVRGTIEGLGLRLL